MAARRESDLQAALDFLSRAEVADVAAMPPELVDVLRALVKEEAERLRACRALSDREREVLTLVDEGKTNAEIADVLAIAPTTVRTHLEHVYRKLDVHSRTAALARARRFPDRAAEMPLLLDALGSVANYYDTAARAEVARPRRVVAA